MKREIRPEELEFVFELATRYQDLRNVGHDLDELTDLRERVKELVIQLDGGHHLSVGDLIKLQVAGTVTKAEVRRLLGLPVETAPAPPASTPAPARDYTVKDRRVTA